MKVSRLISFALAASLAACAQFPQLDATLEDTDADTPYPRLLPKSTFGAATTAVTITPAVTTGIENRVDALRARATRLRGSALTPSERARLENAINR